jgi:hypothetical protein
MGQIDHVKSDYHPMRATIGVAVPAATQTKVMRACRQNQSV